MKDVFEIDVKKIFVKTVEFNITKDLDYEMDFLCSEPILKKKEQVLVIPKSKCKFVLF